MKIKVEPEEVCPEHAGIFKEIVECYACHIYPQDQINEQKNKSEREGYKRGLRKAEDMFRYRKSDKNFADILEEYRRIL